MSAPASTSGGSASTSVEVARVPTPDIPNPTSNSLVESHDCEDDSDCIQDIESDFSGLSGSSYRAFSFDVNYYSASSVGSDDLASERCDFLRMTTAISQVYKRGIYLKMINSLDGQQWERVGHGTNFQVSRSEISFQAVSARNPAIRERVSNKLVLKRNSDSNAKLDSTQIRGFIQELRILDHFHFHPFIVNLRGVGWFAEFCDDHEPSPKPAILLEEAEDTLDYLIAEDASLEWNDSLRIFAQITSGLKALHASGIAHGDLKPGNVLIFKKIVNMEGVQIQSYTAKLSDFESAVVDIGRNQRYPPGTQGYIAPEAEAANKAATDASSFENILLADIWSLGILFAVLIGRPKKVFKEDRSIKTVNDRIKHIRSIIRQLLESSSIESSMASNVNSVFDYTLQVKPVSRRLDKVSDILDSYLDPPNTSRYMKYIENAFENLANIPASSEPPMTFYGLGPSFLSVSYENFKCLSGTIKDTILKELLKLSDSSDSRQSSALWNLGLIYLTHFVNPDSSIDEGLRFIRLAAEAGDCRAQAMSRRIHEAFSPDSHFPVSQETYVDMLEQAASAGHQTALEDLRAIQEDDASTNAQVSYASRFYNPILVDDVESLHASALVSKNGDVALHRAAAMGELQHIMSILSRPEARIDIKNLDGETPLMSACRFGRLQAALRLLEEGADAAVRNRFGENCLHYAWCFNSHDGEVLVRALVRHGCSLRDISRRSIPSSDLDLLPVLPGTPLERAVGRRRLDLFILFREFDDTIKPSNGRLARRLLVWALRLHDVALLELLLDFTITDASSADGSLTPIINTTWLHRGERRTLLEAASAGWVSGASVGYDAPLKFWLACLQGKDWKTAMKTSMMKILELEHRSSPGSEELLDKAIRWTFTESHHDAFVSLLHLKVEWTANHSSKMDDHRSLHWSVRGENICIM